MTCSNSEPKEALQCSRELYVSHGWGCFWWLKLVFWMTLDFWKIIDVAAARVQWWVMKMKWLNAGSRQHGFSVVLVSAESHAVHDTCTSVQLYSDGWEIMKVFVLHSKWKHGNSFMFVTCLLLFHEVIATWYASGMVMRRHLIQSGYFGSSLCFSSIMGFSSLWIVWYLQMGKPLAREQGATCLLTACLEICSMPFLHPFSGQRRVRKPVGSAAMEFLMCLCATRRSIVPVEGQEPRSDEERVNGPRNFLGKVNFVYWLFGKHRSFPQARRGRGLFSVFNIPVYFPEAFLLYSRDSIKWEVTKLCHPLGTDQKGLSFLRSCSRGFVQV